MHEGGNNAYYQAYLHKNSTVKNHLVHRLVATHFIGNISKGLVINHKNGNKHDNNVSNLEIVTQQQNIDHSMRTGLFTAIGENHYAAKLTDQDVVEIRQKYAQGCISQRALADMYGVKQSTVFKIVHYQRRKNENYKCKIH